MVLPKEMKALVFRKPGDEGVKTIPLPTLEGRKGYVLIKVHSVALNPTDAKHINWGQGAEPCSIIGCDYAGTIVAIGDGVEDIVEGNAKRWQVGDKIYGCAHGSNASQGEDGVFAEYAVVKASVAMRVPSESSKGAKLELEDLCTVGLGAVTVGQGLFQPGKGKSLGLRLPEAVAGSDGSLGDEEWLFISGGSTATGSLGIQMAKMAGYKVIVTCSPANEAFVRSRGADEVVDYNDPAFTSILREKTNSKLRYAWDAVGDWEPCIAALSPDKGLDRYYGTILGNEDRIPKDAGLHISSTSMYSVFGEAYWKYGENYEVDEQDVDFAEGWVKSVESWVEEGKVLPHPKEVREGGLEGILVGLEDIKEERVRGAKLVYRI